MKNMQTQKLAEAPNALRLAFLNINQQKGLPMSDIKFSDLVTAIATAATALFVYLQMRLQISAAAPHIDAYNDHNEYKNGEGLLLIRLVIFPGVEAAHFTKATAKGADIIKAKFEITGAGFNQPSLPTSPLLRSAPVSLRTSPARTSGEPLQIYFWVRPRKVMSSIRISLHNRAMFFPVKYSAIAEIRIRS